jgi:hypothetical protein
MSKANTVYNHPGEVIDQGSIFVKSKARVNVFDVKLKDNYLGTVVNVYADSTKTHKAVAFGLHFNSEDAIRKFAEEVLRQIR